MRSQTTQGSRSACLRPTTRRFSGSKSRRTSEGSPGAKIGQVFCYALLRALRTCAVTFTDPRVVKHTAEVTAAGRQALSSDERMNPSDVRASKRERFDLCLGMLKAYYDALEGRLEKSLVLLVGVIGWMVTSDTARENLSGSPELFWASVLTLTVVIVLYCASMVHWIKRFRGVQASVDQLHYVEHEYYTRYRFPRWAIPIYLTPVLLLYAFAITCLVFIRLGVIAPADQPLSAPTYNEATPPR